MACRNGVLLVQCSHLIDIQKLAKDLCGTFVNEHDKIQRMSWRVSNKYYEADLNLMTTKEAWSDIRSSEELQSIDALVLAFDPTEERSFDLVKEWLEFVKEHEPAVLLLVCNAFPSDENTTVGLSRQAVLQLCIEHSFELVELNAKPETEDGFMEKVGVARISEAVQTNTWPSMRKRETESTESAAKSKQGGDDAQPKRAQQGIDDLLPDDLPIQAGLDDNDDPGGESFEQLFGRMMEMKQKAASLSDEARKEYAEKVAMSFWQALGGDGPQSDEEPEQ